MLGSTIKSLVASDQIANGAGRRLSYQTINLFLHRGDELMAAGGKTGGAPTKVRIVEDNTAVKITWPSDEVEIVRYGDRSAS